MKTFEEIYQSQLREGFFNRNKKLPKVPQNTRTGQTITQYNPYANQPTSFVQQKNSGLSQNEQKQYQLKVNGQQSGPYTLDQIKQMIKNKTIDIDGDVTYYTNGMESFEFLDSMDALKDRNTNERAQIRQQSLFPNDATMQLQRMLNDQNENFITKGIKNSLYGGRKNQINQYDKKDIKQELEWRKKSGYEPTNDDINYDYSNQKVQPKRRSYKEK